MTSNPTRYDTGTIILHWLTAVLVLVLFTTALAWDYFPRESGMKQILEPLHVSLGILLAATIAARIPWRLTLGRHLPRAGSGLVSVASRIVHGALYGLLVLQIGLGFVLRWLQGDALAFFGLFSIPSPLEASRELSRIFEGAHNFVAWTLLILVGGHAIAALIHHHFLRDGVLLRMFPNTGGAIQNRR